MSKKVVNIKTVVDSLLQNNDCIDELNKLIKEFNKNCKNKYKLKEINQNNKKIWINLKYWLKKTTLKTNLENIYKGKLKKNYSCLQISMDEYFSVNNIYAKLKDFYTLAEKYIIYHHLVDELFFTYNS